MYSPTLQAEIGVKKAFYRDLHDPLQQVDSKDKLRILGNFGARVGRDFELWKAVLGRHGIDNCINNGRLLLEFCSEHQLVITNSPEGSPGMSDVSPLSGISGLSFDSTLLCPLLFFCLVLLPFLSYRFLPAGPFF